MSRRKFHRRIYLAILKRQRNYCACNCGIKMTRAEGYQFDHIHALIHGGPDTPDNLRALRTPCHKRKSRADVQAHAKVKRIQKRADGQLRRKKRAIQSRGFDKRFRKRMDGTVEKRA